MVSNVKTVNLLQMPRPKSEVNSVPKSVFFPEVLEEGLRKFANDRGFSFSGAAVTIIREYLETKAPQYLEYMNEQPPANSGGNYPLRPPESGGANESGEEPRKAANF